MAKKFRYKNYRKFNILVEIILGSLKRKIKP